MRHKGPAFLRATSCTGLAAEAKAAKRLGAKQRPGSGAIPGAKGDMTLKQYLLESKATTKKSLTLEQGWLNKISGEALEINRDPALLVQFTDDQGRLRKNGSWVMIPEALFLQLVEVYDGPEER